MKAIYDDSCLWSYVIVDEVSRQIAAMPKHPGPTTEGCDSELLTIMLVNAVNGSEKRGCRVSEG